MAFRESVISHLENYKKKTLKIEDSGTFRGKVYDHILPFEKKNLNILPQIRDSFFRSQYKRIKLHKSFHHLNSSQAMCINFFFPFLKYSTLKLVFQALGIPADINCQSAQFEKHSHIDCGFGETPTSFDFFSEGNLNGVHNNFYFEIKYTEDSFGFADKDQRHDEKIDELYLPLAKPVLKEACHSRDFIRHNYQIVRNLLHLGEDSFVIFIFPKNNSSISKMAKKASEEMILDKFKSHFIYISWEKIVEDTRKFLAGPKNQEELECLSEFENKYLPI